MTGLRAATETDRSAIWTILEPVIRAGETYAFPTDWTEEAALVYWLQPAHSVFVLEENGILLGSFYLRTNQPGNGDHVCNAGFVTAPDSGGRGVARRMLAHALDVARARGYRAMQFNFVVATNQRAIAIWESHGFHTVGRLPSVFRHPHHGEVDALVMHRQL